MRFTNKKNKYCTSPNGEFTVTYGELSEFAMGSPLYGACYFNTENEQPLLLHSACLSFPTWRGDSSELFFTVLATAKDGARCVKIVSFNTKTNELTVFEKEFINVEIIKLEGDVLRTLHFATYKFPTKRKAYLFDLITEPKTITKLKAQ